MSTTLKTSYASSSTITCTLTSLANASARQSTVVDNTSNLYIDALIGGEFTTGSGTLSTPAFINIYVYALTDGTNYSGSATGSDSAWSLPTYKNVTIAATVYVNTAGTIEYFSPRSVAACFGGVLPAKWGVIVENETGLSLSSGTITYTGINLTNG
jgi:hypothetical protein